MEKSLRDFEGRNEIPPQVVRSLAPPPSMASHQNSTLSHLEFMEIEHTSASLLAKVIAEPSNFQLPQTVLTGISA
jgi:hypothetical protein